MRQAQMLGGLAVADRLGVARETAMYYRRSIDRRGTGFPEPDGRIGRAPWWWSTTVDEWLESQRVGQHRL